MFPPIPAFSSILLAAAMPMPHDPRRRRKMSDFVFLAVQIAVLAALFLILVVMPVLAQDGSASSTFDFGPLVTQVLNVLGPAIGTVVALIGLWVLKRLADFLGLKIDDSRRAAIEQALLHGVAYTIEQLGERARGGIPVDVKSDAIRTLARYAEDSVPDAIEHFGITPERLKTIAESRLAEVLIGPDTVVSSRVIDLATPSQPFAT